MADYLWGVEVGDETQLRDDLAQECGADSADYAIIRRMVNAALVTSLVDDRPGAREGGGDIVIPFRAWRASS